jgi:hypothetical protein
MAIPVTTWQADKVNPLDPNSRYSAQTVNAMDPNSRYSTQTWTPDPRALVQDRMTNLLDQNNAYLQQAKTQGLQQAQQRGLLNSSLAVGAAQNAAIQSALPIATQDAQTFATAFRDNAAAENATRQFNAQAFTTRDLANQSATNQASRDNASMYGNLILNNQTAENQARGANASAQNSAATANAELANRLAVTKLQQDAETARLPQITASNLANTTAASVNTIMADGTLDAKQKQAAIDNVLGYANAQVQWTSALYNTPIPNLTRPEYVTPTT